MKHLFVFNDAPYGSERTYNGLRLAGSMAKRVRATEAAQQVRLAVQRQAHPGTSM